MRKITKGNSPNFFELWKQSFRSNNNREATYDDLLGEIKGDFREYLMNEQYGLCCYCMKRLTEYDCHIEHIKPQSLYLNDTLDYNNMLVSCNGSKPYMKDRESCGHRRENWYDNNYISPLEHNVESHFTYNINGKIEYNEDDIKASETVRHLNLNCYSLIQKRKTAIYLALDTDVDKDEIIKEYSTPVDGVLPEYCVAVLGCL